MITGQNVLELALPHRMPLDTLLKLIGDLPGDMNVKAKWVEDFIQQIQESSNWVETVVFGESWEESELKKLHQQKLKALKYQFRPEDDMFSRGRALRERCIALSNQCAGQYARSLGAISSSIKARAKAPSINLEELQKLREMERELACKSDFAAMQAKKRYEAQLKVEDSYYQTI